MDQLGAPVVGIGLPGDQPTLLEPIDDVGQGRALVAELAVKRRGLASRWLGAWRGATGARTVSNG
jgi:hypothetical protein